MVGYLNVAGGMTDAAVTQNPAKNKRDRIKKSERRKQILLELKLRPHVRISEFAERFQVSTETVRRDFDTLADDASAPAQGHYPGLDERANDRIRERERIGERAARLVQDGDTVMIDSGSTTIQMARALAYLGTSCTVITNSIPVAMTLGSGAPEVILCPGEYQPAESAVVGTDTLDFLSKFNVDRCLIGASGFSEEGLSESVRGFAAVKKMMLQRAAHSQKFGRKGMAQAGSLGDNDTIVEDQAPTGHLLTALNDRGVEVLVAE